MSTVWQQHVWEGKSELLDLGYDHFEAPAVDSLMFTTFLILWICTSDVCSHLNWQTPLIYHDPQHVKYISGCHGTVDQTEEDS